MTILYYILICCAADDVLKLKWLNINLQCAAISAADKFYSVTKIIAHYLANADEGVLCGYYKIVDGCSKYVERKRTKDLRNVRNPKFKFRLYIRFVFVPKCLVELKFLTPYVRLYMGT